MTAPAPAPAKPRLGRPFGALVTGVLASNASDGFAYFAAPLLVLTITKDPVAVAGVTAVMLAVPALFGVIAGSLADTRDRRLLMTAAALVRGVVLAALVVLIVTDAVTLPALFVALALFAAAELTFDISSSASVPDVLDDLHLLERAHGVIGAGQQVLQGFIVGPFATLFFAWSAQLPFTVGAVLVLVSAVAVIALRRMLDARDGMAADGGSPGGAGAGGAGADGAGAGGAGANDSVEASSLTFRERMAGGASEVRHNQPLRNIVTFTIVLVTLVGFGQAAYTYYMVEFLDVPTAVLGLVFMALGVGGILGSVTVHALAARFTRRLTMFAGVFLVAAGFGVVGLAPVGAWAPWVTGIGFFAAGLGAGWWNVLAIAARQRMVPREKLGRVNGFVTTVNAFIAPVAALAGGWVTRMDARLPWYVAAVGSVLAVLLMGRLMGSIDDDDVAADLP